ncbi:MAG: hypothetical protein K0U64_04455 [Actinomycetia bacterium]|nr:hypothetical protein [Actinomycetes bacterium]
MPANGTPPPGTGFPTFRLSGTTGSLENAELAELLDWIDEREAMPS